jgi:hypothetical protein
MTPEVAKRLGEITVDPKTVTLAKPAAKSDGPAADVNGKWSLAADANGQTLQIAVELKQTGPAVVGSTSSPIGNGTIDGGKVNGKSFTGILHADVQGQTVDFTMEGTIDGDKMTGTFTNPGFGSIPFTATRDK